MAYTSIEVMDWESDGSFGTLRIPIPMPVVVEQEGNYTQLTGCVIESKPYLVVIESVVMIISLVYCCRTRTLWW